VEFLIELIAEFLFQSVFEVAAAMFDGSLNLSSRMARNSVKSVFYVVLGVVFGAVSLFFWPLPMISATPNAWISLLLVPASVAVFIVYFSRWIETKRKWDIELEQFSFSFLFAFVFAAVRYFYMVRAA
jgi:hypothetical protein